MWVVPFSSAGGCPGGRRDGSGRSVLSACRGNARPAPCDAGGGRTFTMRGRPDYMPPIRLGEGRWSDSPRFVYRRLIFGPPSALAFVVLSAAFGAPVLFLILIGVVLIVECVQAVVYIPRARHAMAEERTLLRPDETPSKRLGTGGRIRR